MSVTITLLIGGQPLVAELEQNALLAIAAAIMPTETTQEWFSVESAAAYLDVSVERLRKLKDRREIPFVQEGRGCRIFFSRVDLDEWMRGFRHPAQEVTPNA